MDAGSLLRLPFLDVTADDHIELKVPRAFCIKPFISRLHQIHTPSEPDYQELDLLLPIYSYHLRVLNIQLFTSNLNIVASGTTTSRREERNYDRAVLGCMLV